MAKREFYESKIRGFTNCICSSRTFTLRIRSFIL